MKTRDHVEQYKARKHLAERKQIRFPKLRKIKDYWKEGKERERANGDGISQKP